MVKALTTSSIVVLPQGHAYHCLSMTTIVQTIVANKSYIYSSLFF